METGDDDDLEGMDFDSLDAVSKLIGTERYKRVVKVGPLVLFFTCRTCVLCDCDCRVLTSS